MNMFKRETEHKLNKLRLEGSIHSFAEEEIDNDQ